MNPAVCACVRARTGLTLAIAYYPTASQLYRHGGDCELSPREFADDAGQGEALHRQGGMASR